MCIRDRLLRSSGIRLGKTVKREGALILRPMETGHVFTGKDGVALVGEAAGWISPSSAEGISYACLLYTSTVVT